MEAVHCFIALTVILRVYSTSGERECEFHNADVHTAIGAALAQKSICFWSRRFGVLAGIIFSIGLVWCCVWI